MNPVVKHLAPDAAFAWEAAALAEVAEDPNQRRFLLWDCPQALVVPKKLASLPRFDAASAASEAAGWPVSIRGTGGDATPQGPGILNVTHVYASPPGNRFDMAVEYDRLCAPIEAALGAGASRGWMPGAFCDGAYNVQWQGRKFAGTAMRFRRCKTDKIRHAVMAHAILLMAPPSEAVISALNALLSGLGEYRVIDRSAHAGLPDGTDQATFLTRLTNSFAALPDLDPELPS